MYLIDSETLLTRLHVCRTLHETYEHILESYVSDYYVEKHWNKLPDCWQSFFAQSELSSLGNLLNYNVPLVLNKVCPLSLICLRLLLAKFTFCRRPVPRSTNEPETPGGNFLKYLWKNVKQKKRHEIDAVAKLCRQQAASNGCHHIVDIGSGVGHLSRMLSYGYGFKVCTFEANETLVKSATALDEQFETLLDAKAIKHRKTTKTVHLHEKITSNTSGAQFLQQVLKHFKDSNKNLQFGLIGLHPCGDLGPTLLRLFNQVENVRFILIASCCYMKMSFNHNFPLSGHCIAENMHLKYLSCEIACHSIENYVEKCAVNRLDHLKVHAFRAALEHLLISIDPRLKHTQLCSAKYSDQLTFSEYCERTLRERITCLGGTVPDCDYERIIKETWTEVAKFYSVRLLVAPAIETIILIDRVLYLQENGHDSFIVPLFEPEISPRNLLLIGVK